MTQGRTIGEGDVTIKLEDGDIVLKPSLFAMQGISRKFGGLQDAINRMSRLDFDAIADVVEFGMGAKNTPPQKMKMAERLYAAGMTDSTGRIAERCIDYIQVLMSGGRKPAQPGEEGQVEGNAPPPT